MDTAQSGNSVSCLHTLLGYDHMEPDEAAVMEAKQAKALEDLGITR